MRKINLLNQNSNYTRKAGKFTFTIKQILSKSSLLLLKLGYKNAFNFSPDEIHSQSLWSARVRLYFTAKSTNFEASEDLIAGNLSYTTCRYICFALLRYDV